MIRAAAATALIIGSSCVIAHDSAVQALAGSGDSAETAGVKLMLAVPKRAYPRNALVRVTVRLRNVSSHDIQLYNACPYGAIWVQVVNRHGAVVYPPAVRSPVPQTCPPAVATPLSPGRAVQRRVYVIFHAERLQPVVAIPVSPTTPYVVGKAVTVRLTRAKAPRVNLTTSTTVQATIHLGKHGGGRSALYMESELCAGGTLSAPQATGSATETTTWTKKAPEANGTYVFRPGCPAIQEWHVVVGLPGRRVAFINYVKQGAYVQSPAVRAG